MFRVNRAFASMLGYEPEQVLSGDPRDLTHPDDWVTDSAYVERLLAGDDSSVEWEKRYLHADGHIVWGHVSPSLVRGADQTPMFLVAQIADAPGAAVRMRRCGPRRWTWRSGPRPAPRR